MHHLSEASQPFCNAVIQFFLVSQRPKPRGVSPHGQSPFLREARRQQFNSGRQSPFSYLRAVLSNIRLSFGERPRGVNESDRRKINCRESIMVDLKNLVMTLFSPEDTLKASDLPWLPGWGRMSRQPVPHTCASGPEPNPAGTTPKEPFTSTVSSLRCTEYRPL